MDILAYPGAMYGYPEAMGSPALGLFLLLLAAAHITLWIRHLLNKKKGRRKASP
jgi:hypothetical protein